MSQPWPVPACPGSAAGSAGVSSWPLSTRVAVGLGQAESVLSVPGPDGVTEWKGCQAWRGEGPAGGRWAGVPPGQPLSFRPIRWRELCRQEQVGAERAPVCTVGRRARSCLGSGGWGRCWGRPCCQPGTATTAPKLPVPVVVVPGQPPCRGSVAVWMLWAVLSTQGPGPAALARALRCPCVRRHTKPTHRMACSH